MFYPTEYENSQEILIKKQKEAEKKEIRKASNLLGVCYLLMMVVMSFWILPFRLFVGLFSEDKGLLNEILSDTTIFQVVQITVSSVAFIVSFYLYTVFMKVRLSDVGSFNRPKRKDLIFPMVLLGLGVCGFSNAVVSLAGSMFQSIGFNYTPNDMGNPTNVYGIILSFVATAVTPALVEEFALRGAVMGTLRKYGEGFAVIISSIFFGLMHRNISQIPFALILGLVFGYAVIRTGSIWTAVIIHFLNNFVSALFDYILSGLGEQTRYIISWIYFAVLMAIGVIGLIMLHKKGENSFNLDNSGGKLTVSEKIKVVFTSPLIIISVVVTAIDCIGALL